MLGATGWPSPASSPWIRRYPQVGLSVAVCSTSRRICAFVLGRPGWGCGWVQYRLTSALCHRIRVVGVMNRCARRALDSNPDRAVISARSAQDRRGRLTWRRRSAFSWRSSRISAVLAASLRARSASQPRSCRKIR